MSGDMVAVWYLAYAFIQAVFLARLWHKESREEPLLVVVALTVLAPIFSIYVIVALFSHFVTWLVTWRNE